MKIHEIYCNKCGKRTAHKYVGRESNYEGYGIARVMLAVCSLGLSESSICSDLYYECLKCGKIHKQ